MNLYSDIGRVLRGAGVSFRDARSPKREKAEVDVEPFDITRKVISFPAPRSARLQVMAQGDVGSLQSLAYSSVRGYSDVHPTLYPL